MKTGFLVAGRAVGPGQPAYRIADAAAHHDGDVQLGYKLIETAGRAGAHAITFQAPGAGGPLSERDFKSLLGHAQYVGLTAFGTADDDQQVSFLASLDVPAFVLARPDPELLRAAAALGKPLFVLDADGTAAREAIEGLRAATGGANVAVLHRHDATSLIDADGHVIMTRHTLHGTRPASAAGAARKGQRRA
jgi:sialic acid synthase SpsE